MAGNPSTAWQERIAADEGQRFANYAKVLGAIQTRASSKFGPGRGLHRKSPLNIPAVLVVKGDLPSYAAQGLFATPGRHEAIVRLSNGSPRVQADKVPDIRGFAIKVTGINGPSALGEGQTQAQDFLLINRPAFAFPTADDFVGLVEAVSRGFGALLSFFVRRFGLFGGLGQLAKLIGSMKAPFSGFASETMFSAAPIAWGAYAARLRLVPNARPGAPAIHQDLGREFLNRLEQGDLTFDLQAQFFLDEPSTPIEDASIDWPAPYLSVATLTIAQSSVAQARDPGYQAAVEAMSFDPWHALADHRPLGNVMRARKVVYFASAQARGAA